MKYLKAIFALIKETGVGYGRDKGALLAAALAYHTIFSLAPLLVISVAVAGYFLGEAAVTGQLVTQIEGVVGRAGAEVIQNLIRNASEGSTGLVATIVSTALLIWGASGVFNQLKTALNLMWGIAPPPNQGVVGVVKGRFLAIFLVMGIGFLLLMALFSNAMLVALDEQLVTWWPAVGGKLPTLNFVITFLIVTLLFAIIFKTLPDATIVWRDALMGGSVTSLLFGIGQWGLGLYLRNSSVGSAYGATSSLIVLLFWIYMSAQILMFGAEFTQVFAKQHGGGVMLADNALVLRREAVNGAEPEPKVVHNPTPMPLATAVSPPPPSRRIPLATALVGLAAGLFLGVVGSLLRQK
ncbi:MAG: YihY/virulence factor BrkB family protein [Chloroflexota bacterium]